jgi:hypothetical protein
MTASLDLQRFAEVLHAHLASHSIHTNQSEHSHAEASIPEIEQALEEPGTTIFVYGDLDTGTSPMAHISNLHDGNGTANPPLGLLIRDAEGICASRWDATSTPPEKSGDEQKAISILLRNAAHPDEDITAVIREFGQVISNEERKHFQDLLLEISEQRGPVRFVLCGVSDSLYELLRAHESCYEYTRSAKPVSVAGTGYLESSTSDRSAATEHYVHIVPETLICEMLSEPTFARNLR